jgi:hypothetical protein
LAEDARRRDQAERREINTARPKQINQATQAWLRHRGGQIKRGNKPAGLGDIGVEALRDRHQRRRQHGRIDWIKDRTERERRDEFEAKG